METQGRVTQVYATYARISIYQPQLGCREEKLASPFRVFHAREATEHGFDSLLTIPPAQAIRHAAA
ncbi:protein of unknown function [Bradyrhizobium vignae]|uniref:Uncharacterized protein n=1 Tax=Bradyrhizobium vignae TaxID=1549949 RepID=A0A2U3PUS9_9BRAD|nr:protein of unknown function [Bradyrhizobium vignae]